MIYPECQGCAATPFCKLYSKEVISENKDWCRAKFRLDKATRLAGIPVKYTEANLHNYVVDEENTEAYAVLSDKVPNIVSLVDEGKNFFFYGSRPGTGKTYAAACLLNHYIYKSCMTSRFNFEDPLAMFVDFSDLMDDLRYSKNDDYVQEKVEDMRNVPLLLLDDIGSSKITEFVLEQTFRVINYRLNHGLSTIITSNYTMKQLSSNELFGMRIVSRLLSGTFGAEVDGKKDRRRG